MADQPRFLLIGEVLRPHGIRGELKIRVLTDYPERLAQLEHIYVGHDATTNDATRYRVQHIRPQNEFGLLKLEGVNTRDQADLLRNLYVMVALENAVPLEEGEFYVFQLIGLNVQTVDGQQLGRLTDVLATGANDVYVVDSPTYGEILIPALSDTILDTNLDAGTVIVRLPEGTLPAI
jgi:16S rRNA processing protein RimM